MRIDIKNGNSLAQHRRILQKLALNRATLSAPLANIGDSIPIVNIEYIFHKENV
jgi:hypothetical protein